MRTLFTGIISIWGCSLLLCFGSYIPTHSDTGHPDRPHRGRISNPDSQPPAPYFTNIAKEVGLTGKPAHRVLWTNINEDHWADCVIYNLGKKSERNLHLFLNVPKDKEPLERVFKEVTNESRINQHPTETHQKRIADTIIFADIDNDGDMDAFSGKYCDLERPILAPYFTKSRGPLVVLVVALGLFAFIIAARRRIKWLFISIVTILLLTAVLLILPQKRDPQTNQPLRGPDGKIVMANLDDGLRSEIFLNDGKGRFSILKNSGLNKKTETTTPAVFFDYDNDGLLDLFIGNWYRQYTWSLECYPSRLYKGNGDGTFEETTQQAGLMTTPETGKRNSSRPVYGIAHCDWNNDGWQDILVCAYGRQWNFLWKNLGDGRFVDVAEETGFDGDENRDGTYPPQINREKELPFRANGNTFDAACADFDNDGDIDVFLSEITHWWAGSSSDLSGLLINQGKEKGFKFYRDPNNLGIIRPDTPCRDTQKNWNQGDLAAGWLDFNNDGLLDLLIASSDYPDGQYLKLYQQQPDHTFVDVTAKAGFNWECASSISLADFDRDGDVDILVGKSFMRLPSKKTKGKIPEAGLFRNNIGNKNNWLNITLVGKGKGGTNRSGIGTRVVVTCGNLKQTREVYGGLGHTGHQDSLDLKFGLGKHNKIDSIEVYWANKEHTIQIFQDIKPNSFIRITEDKDKIEYLR